MDSADIDIHHIQKKTDVIIELFIELYRVFVGSCLIIFVPQNCNGTTCGMMENIWKGDIYYDITFFFNIFTLLSFLIMYIIEMTREYCLIDYLNVNIHISNDNESVGKRIDKMDIKRKEYIWTIDVLYCRSGFIAILFFSINTFLSAIVIFNHYLDNKTVIGFLTNILFMTIKLNNVRLILSTEKNIFYSAYLKNFVQFNDLDKSEKERLLKQIMDLRNMEENSMSSSNSTEDILNYTDIYENLESGKSMRDFLYTHSNKENSKIDFYAI